MDPFSQRAAAKATAYQGHDTRVIIEHLSLFRAVREARQTPKAMLRHPPEGHPEGTRREGTGRPHPANGPPK